MADPVLSLTQYTAPVNLDLSSVTGSGAAWDYLDGDVGSDWYKREFSYLLRQKTFGMGRVIPVLFNDGAGAITSGSNTARQLYSTNFDVLGYNPFIAQSVQALSTTTTFYSVASAINWGVRWQIEADQKLRELVLINDAYFYSGAAFTLKATLGDSSYAIQTFAMPSNSYGAGQAGDCTAKVLYRSRLSTTITIELRCVSNPGGDAVIAPIAGYLKMPINPPVPRSYAHMLSMRNGVARG